MHHPITPKTLVQSFWSRCARLPGVPFRRSAELQLCAAPSGAIRPGFSKSTRRAGALRSAGIAILLAAVQSSDAQLGTGWVQYSPTKRIHLDDEAGLQTFTWTSYKSVCSPICADYRYESATDTETFRILDSRSNRSEIRLQNEYSSGRRQFQGYLTFFEPLHDESLFQIFGNTGDAATFTMMRGYRDNNGTIRVMGGSHTIATGIYGVEVRINIIHDHNVNAKFYVNGTLAHTKTHNDPGAVNYHKYGCYGTTSGNVPAVVKWRGARSFRDGQPPAGNPDFSVSASPSSRSITVGSSTTYTVTVSPQNGFDSSVALSVTGLPAGATASFNPSSVTGSGTSVMTVTTTASTPVTTSALTVRAVSGTLTRTAGVSLQTTPAPDFSVSASPASQTVTAGNSTTYNVTITGVNGFSGSATLSASGLPAGASASFNPASVTGSGSSTMTVTTTASTTPGTGTLTITGTSGSLTRSTTADLTVNAPPAGLFFQAESLSIATNGAGTVLQNDVAASGGQWISFNADGVGDWIEYTLPSVPAGTYDVTLLYKRHPNRGTHSLSVDGVVLNGTLDQYNSAVLYTEKSFGTITFTTAGTHKVRLTVTGKNASSTVFTISADAIRLTAAARTWLSQDIGAVGIAGSFSENAGAFTVAGSGSDIWTAADQFRYGCQAVSGDMTITARVVSEQQTHAFAKAGVMIRQSLATNSVHAAVLLTPTNGVSLHIRPSAGATSINVSGWVKGPVPPHWVRLQRAGNTFTAFHSADGVAWTQFSQTNVTMSAGITTGLAVSSHNNAALNTATFDSVTTP